MSQSLWERLEHQLPTVADRAVQAYADASPRYQGTVPEHLYRHMAHTCREGGRLCVRMIREQRGVPREEELRLFRDRGFERGAEGLPVSDFVEAYFFLAESLWQELSQLAGGEPPATAAVVLLRCVRSMLHVAVQAHQQEFQAAHSEKREAVRETVRALVAGEPAGELAQRPGPRLATSYAVIALRVATHSTESVGDAVGRRLAGRRKIYRITEQLTRTFGEDTLSDLDPDGGLVLVPSTPDGASRDLAGAHRLARLQDAEGIAVSAGFAHAAGVEAVPAAARQAQRLLQLAVEPGQVAVLDDMLFEYHQKHDSDAVPHLLSIAGKLRHEPDLLATVTAYYSNDFNRRETARQLHVHPNTVDNRLARTAVLTGADPRTARGLLLLGAALGVSRRDD